MKDFFLGLN